MNIVLQRNYTDTRCTLGVLTAGTLVLQTLELPWLPVPWGPCGTPFESCVPAGSYALALHDSPAHPRTWALVNTALGLYDNIVPNGLRGRTDCLVHVANYPGELEGCIGVGISRLKWSGSWMIAQSDDAFALLRAALPWEPGSTLAVMYAPGVEP
jgi:uncharacterized protein DUF5675